MRRRMDDVKDPTRATLSRLVGDVFTLASPEWWLAIRRVAATCVTRDEFDSRTRELSHDVYQAYQTIEGNALTAERKAAMRGRNRERG